MAALDVFRPVRTAWHKQFVHGEQTRAQNGADHKIRRTNPPQADARRAHGGDFVCARVVRERVEQRQQQRDGQHHHQKFRRDGHAVFNHVEKCSLRSCNFSSSPNSVKQFPKSTIPPRQYASGVSSSWNRYRSSNRMVRRLDGARCAGQVLSAWKIV